MPRKYEQTARAVRRGATRQRIIEAIAGLHTEVGPALTTVSEIAERAGVERLTVYRHFPDEASMYQACGAYVYSLHPPPDVEGWKTIEDPLERLTRGLAELYVFYAQTERITAVFVNRKGTHRDERKGTHPGRREGALVVVRTRSGRSLGLAAEAFFEAVGVALKLDDVAAVGEPVE